MNAVKMSGAMLVASGVLLMFLGSAIIPVNAQVWGDVVEDEITDCNGSCNNCGAAILQGPPGRVKCLRWDGDPPVLVNGTCDTSGDECDLCAGGCETADDGVGGLHCVCKLVEGGG